MTIPIYGEPPVLVGRVLEAIRWQGFICKGEVVPGACLVYLKVEGSWHRLVIDFGTVHWYREADEPKTWLVPDEGFEYPVHELAGGEELTGVQVSSMQIAGFDDAISVEVRFENGRKLLFTGKGDRNELHAA